MPHLLQHTDMGIAIRIAALQCEYCHSKCMYVHCFFTVVPNKQRLLQNLSFFFSFRVLNKVTTLSLELLMFEKSRLLATNAYFFVAPRRVYCQY